MRRLAVAAAALALAACQVDVEGAACEVPGATAQCPSGQACGNDLRCSRRAAACDGGPCTPGQVTCSAAGDVVRCDGTGDAVCGGTWTQVADCGAGVLCGLRTAGADPVCYCPDAAGGELWVDPVAGAPQGEPAPTGAREPAQCRFRALSDALARAAEGGGTSVVAAGAVPAVYPVAADLVIPPGVTLRGDDAPAAPAGRILALGDGVAAAGVTLGAGSTLAGVTVRDDAAPDAAVAIRTACAAGDPARVADVAVAASREGGALAAGLRLEGSCPVALERVTVSGAAGPGVAVVRELAVGAPVTAEDSVLQGNVQEGLRLGRGDVTLLRVTLAANGGAGLVAAAGADGRITLEGCTIRDNGATGVVLEANTARVWITGTRICRNAATQRGAFTTKRAVGGLYLAGNPPAAAQAVGFSANAIHGNAGDQVLVSGSVTPWHLDGGADACGAGRNVFGEYAPSPARGLVADSAVVSARWNGWAGVVPAPGIDYEAITGVSPASVDALTYCDPPTAAELVCE